MNSFPLPVDDAMNWIIAEGGANFWSSWIHPCNPIRNSPEMEACSHCLSEPHITFMWYPGWVLATAAITSLRTRSYRTSTSLLCSHSSYILPLHILWPALHSMSLSLQPFLFQILDVGRRIQRYIYSQGHSKCFILLSKGATTISSVRLWDRARLRNSTIRKCAINQSFGEELWCHFRHFRIIITVLNWDTSEFFLVVHAQKGLQLSYLIHCSMSSWNWVASSCLMRYQSREWFSAIFCSTLPSPINHRFFQNRRHKWSKWRLLSVTITVLCDQQGHMGRFADGRFLSTDDAKYDIKLARGVAPCSNNREMVSQFADWRARCSTETPSTCALGYSMTEIYIFPYCSIIMPDFMQCHAPWYDIYGLECNHFWRG